eukprot:3952992-Pleurochrysis_carterae.AAC.2
MLMTLQAHAGRGGTPRLAESGRPADQGACGPQPEGRQGAAKAGGPARPLQAAPSEERGLPGSLEPQVLRRGARGHQDRELNVENQRLRAEISELIQGHPGAGQGVLSPRRLHPGRRLCHRRGHHDRARLAQP